MHRRFGWAMLIAAGIVIGCALGSLQGTHAASPVRDAEDQEAATAEQLRELKTQVKEINTLLHSGNLRVVIVMNQNVR